jgi:hypothetical protein
LQVVRYEGHPDALPRFRVIYSHLISSYFLLFWAFGRERLEVWLWELGMDGGDDDMEGVRWDDGNEVRYIVFYS